MVSLGGSQDQAGWTIDVRVGVVDAESFSRPVQAGLESS